MTEIRFYHLQRKSLDQALPEILQKAFATGQRIVVRADTDAEAERLNDLLWTFRPDSFLPHGTKKDGHAESQPIWITAKDENPNGADILILTNNQESSHATDYKLCCELFNGNNEDAVSKARARWKTYGDLDCKLTYWQQDASGKWELKKEA